MAKRKATPRRRLPAKPGGQLKQQTTTLDQLQLDPNNVATHDARNLSVIGSSIEQLGAGRSIVMDATGRVIAGNGTVQAARNGHRVKRVVVVESDGDTLVAVQRNDLTPEQARALALADNRSSDLHGYDAAALEAAVAELENLDDLDLIGIGLSPKELEDLLAEYATADEPEPEQDDDDDDDDDADTSPSGMAKAAARFNVAVGQVWKITGAGGVHFLMCGDATNPGMVSKLMGKAKGGPVDFIHADPPYGMGKESQGVAGDNQYREKLDAFQLEWWKAWRAHTKDNGSALIWGTAPDLWRLWYRGGLEQSERLLVRNEIVWDKGDAHGMTSELMTQFPTGTERALFIQIGEQFVGNVNADRYWPGWDPLLKPLAAEAERAGLTSKLCKEITGTSMFPHWFTQSQFAMIGETYYNQLAEALPGYFVKPYHELREVYENLRQAFRDYVAQLHGAIRSYFDNSHEIMRDVWPFARVSGDERRGHATPKPVDMTERAIRSSCPAGGLVAEPFLGTGTTMLAADNLGRRCVGMEIDTGFAAVTLQRMADHGAKCRALK
jgi:DNA modification methylase